MGVIDEHWCNVCKRPLQKGKDDYLEFEFPTVKELRQDACPKCSSLNIVARKRKRPKWRCNNCKATFDSPKKISVEDRVKKKGIICMSCINKNAKLKEAIAEITKAGNPAFVPVIDCLYWQRCPTFQPAPKGKPVRCKHIAISEDKIYCKRSHPGTLELPMEEGELLRVKMKYIEELIQRGIKSVKDPFMSAGIKAAFDMMKQNMWTPPSVVVPGYSEAESKNKGD